MSDDPRNPGNPGNPTDITASSPQGASAAAASHHLAPNDPRRAADPTAIERMIHAQVVARTQAQAATTVVLATIVSLITSAFSFVAALAWNTAIQQLLNENVGVKDGTHVVFGITISKGGVQAIYAVIVTVIAVVVVLLLNRIAKRYANKAAFGNK